MAGLHGRGKPSHYYTCRRALPSIVVVELAPAMQTSHAKMTLPLS